MSSLEAYSNLLGRVQPALARTIEDLREELITCSEEELMEFAKVNDRDWKLRLSFHHQFFETTKSSNRKEKIAGRHIHEGICNKSYWMYYITKPEKVAFLIRPLPDAQTNMQKQLSVAAHRLWELVNQDIYEDKSQKKVDPRRGRLMLDAINMIMDRNIGTSVQRTHVQQVSFTKELKDDDPLVLDARIDELYRALEG